MTKQEPLDIDADLHNTNWLHQKLGHQKLGHQKLGHQKLGQQKSEGSRKARAAEKRGHNEDDEHTESERHGWQRASQRAAGVDHDPATWQQSAEGET